MEGGGNNSTKMTAGVSQLQAAGFVIHASMYAEECPPGIGLDSTGGKVQEMAKKGKIDIMVPLQSGAFITLLSYIFFLAAFFCNQLITIICDQTFFGGPEK